MKMNTDLANIIASGLTTGCIYALIGVGFVVVFRATGVVSFAQGAFMVLGSLLFGTISNHGGGLAVGLVVVCAVLAVVGALIYRLVFARLVGAEAFVLSVATVGLGTLVAAVVLLIWGPTTILITPQFSADSRYHIVGALALTPRDVFTLVLTIVIFALILVGLHRTPIGLRMRAVAGNARLAAHVGVDVVRTSTAAWAIGGLTAGLAGVVYLLGTQPDPGSVYSLGLAAFPAILLGGLDSVAGSLVGGLLIGLLQATVGVYIGGEWQDVVSYGVLLAVLLLRPQGIFGSPEVARL
jgi:branched-chain amino acid transport system permease protein